MTRAPHARAVDQGESAGSLPSCATRCESGETAFERQPQPIAELDRLPVNAGRASRERLTLIRDVRELRGLGYEGGYDAVRRMPAAAGAAEPVAATAAALCR